MPESLFQAWPRIQPVIYFSHGAAAQDGRFNTYSRHKF